MTAMTVTAAVKRDLDRLPDDLATSGMAAVALALAAKLDGDEGSPSECAKALTDVLTRLRDLKPPEREESELDRIRKRRSQGTTGRAAASN